MNLCIYREKEKILDMIYDNHYLEIRCNNKFELLIELKVNDCNVSKNCFDKFLEIDDIVRVENYNNSDLETIILLYISFKTRKIYIDKDKKDIVFAHAIPVYSVHNIKKFVVNNLSICLKQRVINVLSVDTCNIIKTVSKERVSAFLKKEQRLLKKNIKTTIISAKIDETFFDMWKIYDFNRYGQKMTGEFLDIFRNVYMNDGFYVNKYFVKDVCIAQNICYEDKESKILYDLIMPWDIKYKKNRIGYFSIAKNLIKVADLGYSYSLCYGKFGYKNEILNYFT